LTAYRRPGYDSLVESMRPLRHERPWMLAVAVSAAPGAAWRHWRHLHS